MLKKPKQGKFFREFRGELINVDVDYDDKVESNNISDRIAGVISEEVNELNTVKMRLSYSESVQTGIGQKTPISTHSLQECV